MIPNYVARLGFKVRTINIKAQKIDGFMLKILWMVLTSFQVMDKLGRACFLQKIFLLTTTGVYVILGMLFLTFNNVDIIFADSEFP